MADIISQVFEVNMTSTAYHVNVVEQVFAVEAPAAATFGASLVTSVFGRLGAVVAEVGDYTTDQVAEATNQYYTEARVSANVDVAANTAARHTHTNQAELDLVTDGDHDVRLDNPHAVTAAQVGASPLGHTHTEAEITDLGSYIEDAPSDGTLYGRQSGAWAAVPVAGAVRIDELDDALAPLTAVDFSNTKPTFGDITVLQDDAVTSAKLYLGDGTNTGELAAIIVGVEQISYRDDIIGDITTAWIASDSLIVEGDIRLNENLRLNDLGLYGASAIIMGTASGPGNPPWIKFDNVAKEFDFNYPINALTLGAVSGTLNITSPLSVDGSISFVTGGISITHIFDSDPLYQTINWDHTDMVLNAARVIDYLELGAYAGPHQRLSYDVTEDALESEGNFLVSGDLIFTGSLTGTVNHSDLSGVGSNSHATIDLHLASTSNPHGVTSAQVGLGNVANDLQVRAVTNGLSGYLSVAGTPTTANKLLTESAAGAMRYMTIQNMPVSDPVQAALDLKASASDLSTHTGLTNAHIDWTNATADLLTTGDVEADTFTYTNGVARSILFSAQDIRSNYQWPGNWIWQAGFATNSFAYANMDIAASPTIQALLVFNMPADYVEGTDVTFDLGFGTSAAASPYIYNVDIDFIVKAIGYNVSGGGDEYNANGREYVTTPTNSFTLTDVACAAQTFVRKNGIALTSSGSIGTRALKPGDQVLIMFRFKPGTTNPTPATNAHASLVEVHYTAVDTTSC